jgi:arylsulfatase
MADSTKGKGARDHIFYFSQGGDLNAVRTGEWKITFADMYGNLSTAYGSSPAWPQITNLRRDPIS